MSGASRLLIALAVAASAWLFEGAPARGADEDGTQILEGETVGAITADVNGDGVRELVRAVVDPVRATGLLLEAWGHDGESWSLLGSTVVARDSDEGARIPIDLNRDGFALVAWNDGDEERVLLVTSGNVTEGRGCCLTISLMAMDSGLLRAFPLSGTFGDAEMVSVLDFDGDGVDELLVTEPFRDTGELQVRVLDWNGTSGFDALVVELPFDEGFGLPWPVIGETDGIPGEEAVFGPTHVGRFIRLGSAEDGEIMIEETLAESPWPNFTAATGGRLLGTSDEGMQITRWPRGGSMEVTASSPASFNRDLTILGNGDGAVIVDAIMGPMSGLFQTDVPVYDLDLATVLEAPASAETARLMRLTDLEFPAMGAVSHHLLPFVGRLPGGLGDGRHAYFIAGSLVVLESTGELSVQPTNGLFGVRPIGVAGADDGWLALSTNWVGARDTAALYSSGTRDQVTMTPIENVLLDAPADGILSPDLRDAVLVEGRDGTQRLVAPEGGFTATIDAPPGSSVVVAAGWSITFEGEVGDVPLSVRVEPDRESEENQEFEAAILVVTPAGAASGTSWAVEILREPPELTSSAQTDAFALRSTVTGNAPDGATVTVDGQPMETGPDGGFRIEVDAPIWPRAVVVLARDPLGVETVRRLEVVGFFDYRGLPWAPILGVATVAFGILLFVRIPRQRPTVRVADGDGRLEEIDGD